MINKKVRLAPKSTSETERKSSQVDEVLKNYTEAELKYMEINLIREHIENAKQFDFNSKTTDPATLLRIYQQKGLFGDAGTQQSYNYSKNANRPQI